MEYVAGAKLKAGEPIYYNRRSQRVYPLKRTQVLGFAMADIEKGQKFTLVRKAFYSCLPIEI